MLLSSTCPAIPSGYSTQNFSDLPYDVLMMCAEYASVRDILLLSTLSKYFRNFCSPANIALWVLFTERVCLMHPPGMRRSLFNGPILRMYAAINSLPVHRLIPLGGSDDDMPPLPLSIIAPSDLQQWVIDRCEEVVFDVRLFSDILKGSEPRLALCALLIALQAVKKRMWDTEVTDLESVRDLLRSTIVETEHDRGWSVLRMVVGRVGLKPKVLRFKSADPSTFDAERKIWNTHWKWAAAVACEYLQLREVLRVVLAVSEASDHPNAQERYDSVWSALQGTSAMLNAEKHSEQNPQGGFDEVGAAIPIKQGAPGDELLEQVRDLNTVTVGGIVSYYFGCVSGKVQRRAFLSSLFSMKHLTGAVLYENGPFGE